MRDEKGRGERSHLYMYVFPKTSSVCIYVGCTLLGYFVYARKWNVFRLHERSDNDVITVYALARVKKHGYLVDLISAYGGSFTEIAFH